VPVAIVKRPEKPLVSQRHTIVSKVIMPFKSTFATNQSALNHGLLINNEGGLRQSNNNSDLGGALKMYKKMQANAKYDSVNVY